MTKYEYPPHPTLGSDGRYRWSYEVHLLRQFSILADVAKVMGCAIAVTLAIILLVGACSGGMSLGQMAAFSGQLLLIMGAVFSVLTPLGYLLFAWLTGWRYEARFVMDEKELVHRQSPRQVKKAERVGALTAMAGAAAGRPAVVGAGMMSDGRTDMTTRLDSVRRLIPCRRSNMIKVNGRLEKNRVYVRDEDFDFVYQYLREHCTAAE